MAKTATLTRLLSVFVADRSQIEAAVHDRMRNAATADIMQDTWVKLARHDADVSIDNPVAFVRTVARNTAMDYLRKERRRNTIDAEVRDLLWETEDELSPERILIGRQAASMLSDAIEALPEQTRKILLMNRFDGKTHREIAEEMGISESAVYYHIRRSLEHLSSVRQHLPD
jgi:RNA polymerase sigma-70 factor (ECF subfamily)